MMDVTGMAYFAEKESLVFAYRSTNITAKFILSATFELTPRTRRRSSRRSRRSGSSRRTASR